MCFYCVFDQQMKKHWFYSVVVQTNAESIGFTVVSLNKVNKALVLLLFCSHAKSGNKKEIFALVLLVC